MKQVTLAAVLFLVTGRAEAQLDGGVPTDTGPPAVEPAPAALEDPVAEAPPPPVPAPEPAAQLEPEAVPEDDSFFEEPLFTSRLYGYIDTQYLARISGTHSDIHGDDAPVTEAHEPGFDVNLTARIQGAILPR
jgi:hypothetical protein